MKKFLTIVACFMLACTSFAFVGCGKNGDTWKGQISNVEADSVTNYWIEYSQTYSHHPLYSIAKATKDGTTYYYAEYGNNGNNNQLFVILDANGHYKAYNWSYHDSTWVVRNMNDGTELDSEGDDWFEFKTQYYSDYFSTALVGLQYTGEVNSRIRHEKGEDVTNMGETTWTTIGYTNGTHNVAGEAIENCLHFYDEQNDKNYYFAPETHFLLHLDSGIASGCTTKVYKRSFDMSYVFEVHDVTIAGLPISELPVVEQN